MNQPSVKRELGSFLYQELEDMIGDPSKYGASRNLWDGVGRYAL